MTVEGERDVLGMWFQEAEGAKFWRLFLTELEQRGVQDTLICCVDGLKGFPEAIYPQTVVQTCIVHLIRHSLRYVPRAGARAGCPRPEADLRRRRLRRRPGRARGLRRQVGRSLYSEGIGRRSIDPTVLLKLMAAGALEGIGSMRQLLRVSELRLDLRLFLGYGLGERLPAHQTISEVQTQRFADGDVFERLFLPTVAVWKEHALIEGSHLSVDGFHAEANAALGSLRASLEPVAGEASAEAAPDDAPPSERPQLGPTRG